MEGRAETFHLKARYCELSVKHYETRNSGLLSSSRQGLGVSRWPKVRTLWSEVEAQGQRWGSEIQFRRLSCLTQKVTLHLSQVFFWKEG